MKREIAIVLSIVSCLSVVACGKGEAQVADGSAKESVESIIESTVEVVPSSEIELSKDDVFIEDEQNQMSSSAENAGEEQVIGDVDALYTESAANNMMLKNVGTGITVNDSICPYADLGLNNFMVLTPKEEEISGYAEDGLWAVYEDYELIIEFRTAADMPCPTEQNEIIAESDTHVAFKMNMFDINDDSRLSNNYVIQNKETEDALLINIMVYKLEKDSANRFIEIFIPAFDEAIALNFQ